MNDLEIKGLEKIADDFYHKIFPCPGPSRLVHLVNGQHGEKGSPMSIHRCMVYPDCGCNAYDFAVDDWEDAREQVREAKAKAAEAAKMQPELPF